MTNYQVFTSCFCHLKLCLPRSFDSRERAQQAYMELEAQTSPLPLLASDAHKPKDEKKELTVLGYVIDPDYQDEIRLWLV